MDWQPIETAPKNPSGKGNGPFILAFCRYNYVTYQVRWMAHEDGGKWCLHSGKFSPEVGESFSHWMPLPAPPTSTQGGEVIGYSAERIKCGRCGLEHHETDHVCDTDIAKCFPTKGHPMTTLTKEQAEHFREPLKRQIRRDTILHIPISDEMKAVDQLIDLALQAIDMRLMSIENLPASTFAKLFDAKLSFFYRKKFQDWTAHFNGCEVKSGTMLVSEYGYGPTQYDAVVSYQKAIDGKTLVFQAYKASRREIVFNLSALPTGGE